MENTFCSPEVEVMCAGFIHNKEKRDCWWNVLCYVFSHSPFWNPICAVHPEVAEILRKSKPQKVGQNWHKPKISARRLAVLRKQYIDQGYHWPEKPMVDRGLDRLPKGRKDEKRKEERSVDTVVWGYRNPYRVYMKRFRVQLVPVCDETKWHLKQAARTWSSGNGGIFSAVDNQSISQSVSQSVASYEHHMIAVGKQQATSFICTRK